MRRRALALAWLTAAALTAAGCAGTPSAGPVSGDRASATAAPTSVARVCAAPPAGPTQPPAGAVTVDPAVVGDLADKTDHSPAGTTFWLKPGTHKLKAEQYAQVIPKQGDVYLGAPGAVLDGQKVNAYAFTGSASGVVIRYLTVQHFVAPADEGVVNHDSADGWVIDHATVQENGGAGLMAGAHQQVLHSCLRANGQYGMNAYKGDGPLTGLVLEGDEITGNNTDDWETKRPGCGCTGGVKFWAVNGADIRGNWVHDNRGTGLWADTNNNDFRIEDNVIEANDGPALIYEISYNAVIRDNTIRGNTWVEGRARANRGDDFPYGTVYLSESGGEPRIPARTNKIEFYGNVMQDNWSGITLWENADRFCNSPANTSSGDCTLLVKDTSRCVSPGIAKPPLYDDCRWKTQRVDIHDNTFVLGPDAAECLGTCGRMAVLSNYGTYPDWSPYQGDKVGQAITFRQQNLWHDNTYIGPWSFVVHDQSKVIEYSQWRDAPYHQDAGSSYTQDGDSDG